ncbi:MAG: hypothetical protein LBI45_04430 [Bacteroidales bacterium]|jgi:hypothetical protein|nr:hypothetical protein [Bacteroidales bacterium]
MDYEFRKKLYKLDEIGFIGTEGAKETEKVKIIMSYLIQASKKMWKEQNRILTEVEREQIVKEAERVYDRTVRQRRKSRTFDKVAPVAL